MTSNTSVNYPCDYVPRTCRGQSRPKSEETMTIERLARLTGEQPLRNGARRKSGARCSPSPA